MYLEEKLKIDLDRELQSIEARVHAETLWLLIEGREKVRRGWCQGSATAQWKILGIPIWRKRYCMLGAIDLFDRDFGTATEQAFTLLQKVVGQFDVAEWNDAPGRTKREVLAVFDHAIDIASAAQ